MSQHPVNRQVLLVSAKADTQIVLREALFLSNVRAESGDCSLHRHHIADGQCPLPQFTLVCMENRDRVLEKVAEGQITGNPLSLIFIEVLPGEWDVVRAMVEQMWECDHTLRCVFCLPPDPALWPGSMSLSRTERWAILRTPLLAQEVFQLACCLSVQGPSPPDLVSGSPGYLDEKNHSLAFKLNLNANDEEQKTGELESARDALAASKYYVDNILRSMADSLLVINADMTIGGVNPSLLKLLGYQENELIGESPGLIFGEEFAQGAIIENLLLQGSVSGVESSFLTQEGQKILISVSGSMMQDQKGQFQGLVCVAQDITERKRMEEEKLQLHEQLLDTSRQLGMAEVASGVLHNVGNVLNSINVSIGVITDLLKNSLVGDLSRISQLLEKHRENLGAYLSQNPKGKQVPGYLEKLSGQLVEEKRVALLEMDRLRENAGHAQQCVAAHQDFAKPSGMTEPVSLAELVKEALAVHQDLLEGFSVEVTQEYQEVPQVLVDKHQVFQILLDLIRNACQAMESSVIKRLIVRVVLIIGPPDSICLEVQDTGRGIPTDELTKIFGQGYSTKYGGRGLSLHHGALRAKNMGGSLRARSDGTGQGATFFLDLPGHFHFPDL
jgi:PAS domain S-box-containing protein